LNFNLPFPKRASSISQPKAEVEGGRSEGSASEPETSQRECEVKNDTSYLAPEKQTRRTARSPKKRETRQIDGHGMSGA